jgi:outer membrane protein assembly factor BamB
MKTHRFSRSTVLILVVGAVLWAAPVAAATPRAVQPVSTTDWPQFGLTADHRAFNTTETTLSTATVGQLKQTWLLDATPFADLQGPALVGGVLYFGAEFAAIPEQNCMYAVDASTGEILWQSEATQDGFTSAPVVEGGLVIAVAGFPGAVYAFDRATGATVWTKPISNQGAFESRPVVADGVVFVNAPQYGGKLYALDAASGTELWSFTVPQDLLIGAPAVSGDEVFAGTQGGTLYAFKAATGTPRWKADVGVSGFIGITAGPGLVFAGNQDHTLYAFDVDTGEVAWTFHADGEILTTPAFAYSRVFFGTNGGTFYAIKTTTGRATWRYQASFLGYFSGSPVVANGVVYQGEFGQALRAFDARTGDILWSSPTVAQDVTSEPIVADGVVYVTTYDSYAIAYSL